MIYNWHFVSASEMLAVAIDCSAGVWCGSGLDYVARMSGHVCYGVVIHTYVTHLTGDAR